MSQLQNKFQYLQTRLFIGFFNLIVKFFTFFPFLLKKKEAKKDLLMLPYYPSGQVGSRVRFDIYLPFFNQEGYKVDINYIAAIDEMYEPFFGVNAINLISERFKLIRKFYWRRFKAALAASNYKAIYIQRGMFPWYPNQKHAILEKLTVTLNNNVTIDYYDADYMMNKEIVNSCALTANKVSVVNDYLGSYFRKFNSRIEVFPLALSPDAYIVKEKYNHQGPIRLFWTGSFSNLMNLECAIPALKELALEYDLVLVIITNKVTAYEGIKVEHHFYDTATFYEVLHSCDIALYPIVEGDEIHKGAMAMKAMEYMASGLPIIGAPWGLSPHLEAGRDYIQATDNNTWKNGLIELISSDKRREYIGQNGNLIFQQYHTASVSYDRLKEILFKT